MTNNTAEHTNDELRYLLHKINDYEYGLYQIIKSLVFYKRKIHMNYVKRLNSG